MPFPSSAPAVSRRRVVITGLGVVSPLGVGVEAFWRGLREGKSGVGRITLFDPSDLPCQVAAEAWDFDPSLYMEPKELRRVARIAPMGIAAALEAMRDAGLEPEALSETEREELHVIVGSGGGGVEFTERQYELYFRRGPKRPSPFGISSSFVGMVASELSLALDARGMSHVVSTGCTSATDAIGYAFYLIRWGQAEVALTGGLDACITQGLMTGFCNMQVVPTGFNHDPPRASRPFNLDRQGFVLGEGAWLLVLEELERARRRGARVYAEVLGYGASCDNYHRVRTTPDGTGPYRAILSALSDSGLAPGQVDHVNLHGTSTPLNDVTETKALKLAFGEHAYRLSTSATKSMIGHPQGACGAAGVAATALAITEGFIPPTINLE
ncbi:MAG: beta-ketoacyl-[acyl-carrier-protein] synthase family protein, partial [Nitrospinota bacterium]